MTPPGSVAARERARFGPGLYIHYPFCRTRCGYCDFFVVLGDAGARQGFLESLLREIELAADDPLWVDQVFRTVFFGGGTPSLIPGPSMDRVLDRIRQRFQVADGAEITVECNPESLRAESIEAYREAGVTRFSLGVQSMDPVELGVLDRLHGVGEVEQRVAELRAAGLDTFNLDLIYGLPGSGAESWRRTLETTLALAPPHLSAYLLTLEPHVPLTRKLQRAEVASLPVEETAVSQYDQLRREMAQAGLIQYEISNFARPGLESRHNQNYWVRGDYLGLGPSAHSHRDGWRWSNERSLASYHQRIAAGTTARDGEGERLDARAEAEEWIFLGLRRAEGIAWTVLEETGIVSRGLRERAEELASAGWLICDQERLRLDPRGFFVSNTLFTELCTAL